MSLVARRRFLAAAGGLLVAPLVPAQTPGRSYRVGVLLSRGPGMDRYHVALREQLARHGFVNGSNLHIDTRGAVGAFHEDRETVRGMIAARADAIFTTATPATRAAVAATTSVPVAFTWVSDPVTSGIAKSYARPGGNATGVSTRFQELTVKRLELARDLVPGMKHVAVVGNMNYAAFVPPMLPELRRTATQLGLVLIEVLTDMKIWEPAIDEAIGSGAEATIPLAWFGDAALAGASVVSHVNRRRIPAVFVDAETVERGGLISLGTNMAEDMRRGADILARVLKGAKPADMPVDQASRFEMVVNLKTARTMGFTVPQSVLLRADRVIE
jgi:putative tryptophan/tyrosine transport system substrate-binding protein